MLRKQDRVYNHVFARAYIATIVFLLACGSVVAVPFVSNQNQYLAHALSGMNANVRSDWFINTVDPYPFFSAVAKSIYDWFGIDGFRVFALLGTLVAMASVFWLAHLLAKQADHPNAAPLATVAVGLTLPLHINAFEGVGGQYIVSIPAYLQPSMFGCLVLLAIPCLVASRTTNNRNAKTLLLTGAFVLATLGCALHPTYMISALILLAAAFIANVWQSGKLHILYFMVAAALLTAVAVAANPALLSMAVSSPEYSRAVQKFAFERIPQHTKLTGWRYVDIARFLVMLAAIPIAAEKLKHPWLARFLAGSLAVGTTATLVVQVVGSAKLALLFPWRVSVFIMPMSVTVLAVWAASYIEQKAPLWNWRRAVIVLASFVALYGGIGTLLAKSPAETDERTALIKAVHPSGVGLVPVDSDNLRLNASTNIYVDWKSPPYAGPDLIEWWRRIDQERRVEGDAEQFCSVSWHAPIQWMLLPAKANAPSCVSKWRVIGQTKNWRVLGVPPSTPRTSISFRAAVSSATLTISRNSQWYRHASVEAVH